MQTNFWFYPNHLRWQLMHTDTNIDHRRVPNLMVFFAVRGNACPLPAMAEIIIRRPRDLGRGVPHIGIVVDRKAGSDRNMIVHNIGQRPKEEDVLFQWKITGHHRYLGPRSS